MVRSLRAGGGVEWGGENEGAPCPCKGAKEGSTSAILRLWGWRPVGEVGWVGETEGSPIRIREGRKVAHRPF